VLERKVRRRERSLNESRMSVWGLFMNRTWCLLVAAGSVLLAPASSRSQNLTILSYVGDVEVYGTAAKDGDQKDYRKTGQLDLVTTTLTAAQSVSSGVVSSSATATQTFDYGGTTNNANSIRIDSRMADSADIGFFDGSTQTVGSAAAFSRAAINFAVSDTSRWHVIALTFLQKSNSGGNHGADFNFGLGVIQTGESLLGEVKEIRGSPATLSETYVTPVLLRLGETYSLQTKIGGGLLTAGSSQNVTSSGGSQSHVDVRIVPAVTDKWPLNGGFSRGTESWQATGGGTAQVGSYNGDSNVSLLAGSDVALSQQIDTPSDYFSISFDYKFNDTDGALSIFLADRKLAELTYADAPNTFKTRWIGVSQDALLGLEDAPLEFKFTGAESGHSVTLDNVQIFVSVPEPATTILATISLVLLSVAQRRGSL
jgi:hypothetical protein